MHPWSYQAAVFARYFDTTSKATGNEFRDYVFQNQLEINIQNLRSYAEKFAAAHKLEPLPFVIDPSGKLAAQVNADRDLGKAIKLDHTPTVYIVSSRNPSRPYVEVKDNNQLYSTIDAMGPPTVTGSRIFWWPAVKLEILLGLYSTCTLPLLTSELNGLRTVIRWNMSPVIT